MFNDRQVPSSGFLARTLTILTVLTTFGLAAGALADTPEPPWTAYDAITSLSFNDALVADLGLEIRRATPEDGAYSFFSPQPWTLLFRAPGGVFTDVVGGSLRHQGGFELVWRDGRVTLESFEIRPGTGTRTLELVDAQGRVIFVADHMHMTLDLDHRTLRLFNMDLRLSEGFATHLGEARHAGLPVGVLEIQAKIEVPEGVEIPGNSNCALPDWAADVDVGLIGMSSVSQAARSGGLVVVTPSATLKNVGTADVPWYSKFSPPAPPFNNDQHPFLVWAMYRVAGGVIEQLGQSDVKHAFLTINSTCECGSGNILWAGTGAPGHPTVGCEDTYGTGTNNNTNNLAPRDEVTAHTGEWDHCSSHFDQNGDCVQDHFGAGEDAFVHGMVVTEADLEDPDADYYMESWYLVRDDINIFNTMGYRKVVPTFNGSSWSFAFETALIPGPALNAWFPGINPPVPITESNEVLDTGQGRLQLGVKTTNLGGGQVRYVFALMNHDFDRRIDAIGVPLGANVEVSELFFSSPDDLGISDWAAVVTSGAVTWSATASADALDWGTLFTFGFTANAAPIDGEFPLSANEPGTPDTFFMPGLVPGPGVTDEIFTDGFESGDTSAWSN